MIQISQAVLDKLKSIGLNLYERKIYVALLMKGVGTAGDLAEMASVPRSRAYDVLESLAEKGFIVIQHAKPLKYVAVSPSIALEKTKHLLKVSFEDLVERVDKFSKSDGLKELDQLFNSGISIVDAADMSGSFKSSYAMNLQLASMFKNASKSVDIITTENGLTSLAFNHLKTIEKLSRKGVSVRVIAPLSNKNEAAFNQLKTIVKIKDLAKGEKMPYGRLFIVDGKEALIGLTDDAKTHESQEFSFWTSSDHFADSFAKSTFNLIWNKL